MKYRRVIIYVAIAFAALAGVLSSLFVRSPRVKPRPLEYRRPLSVGHGIDYYTDGIYVYERTPPGCGFLGDCDLDIANRPPYEYDELVIGADPASFQFVGDFSSIEAQFYGQDTTAQHIYRDKDHVIYQGEVIWDSDVGSLQLFGGYAKDNRNVYFNGFTLTKLDPETFQLLGRCGFYRDKDAIYSSWTGMENPLTEVDKDSFELIDPERCTPDMLYNARDKNHYYKLDGVTGFRIVK